MARLLNDGTKASALEHVLRPIKKEGAAMKAGTPTLRSFNDCFPHRPPSTLSISFRFPFRSPPSVINHSLLANNIR
jgi:hypothetical protein